MSETYTQDQLDGICASLTYGQALTEVKQASAEFEAASHRLDRARIHCRLAELNAQHEPLAGLLREIGIADSSDPNYDKTRRQLYRAAFFAVHGRIPGL